MGYLDEDTGNGEYYQALSGYFTDYLHNIIALEKRMKELLLNEFQALEAAYQEIFGTTKTFNYSLYKNFINNNLKIFNKNSTIPEVMSLHDVFVVSRFRWDELFKKYFGAKSFSAFEEKFNLCALARNPLAHGHEEYLTKLQIEQVNAYCNEILAIVH